MHTSLRRAWLTALVFLPGESHGQKSLAGYSPWGHTVRYEYGLSGSRHARMYTGIENMRTYS